MVEKSQSQLPRGLLVVMVLVGKENLLVVEDELEVGEEGFKGGEGVTESPAF